MWPISVKVFAFQTNVIMHIHVSRLVAPATDSLKVVPGSQSLVVFNIVLTYSYTLYISGIVLISIILTSIQINIL